MNTERTVARKGLIIYLALVAAGSVPLMLMLSGRGTQVSEQPLLIFLLMWLPALASIIARIILKEGFRDIGFALGGSAGAAAIGKGLLFPLAVGGLAYSIAWLSGLASFTPPTETASPILFFLEKLAVVGALGTLAGVLTAAGEEIGWRGYMTSRLIAAEVPFPAVTGGLIWGFWHVPLIIAGFYAAGPFPLLSGLLFLVLAVALTLIWSGWRLETGSIWPAIIAHAAWNSIIQGPFSVFTTGEQAFLWLGDSGILVVVIALAGALLMTRRRT